MAKHNHYDPMDYRNPWETAKEGCWIVVKKEGCTSMKKIENADYEELEYAAARCYDIVVERIMKFNDDKNGFFSASDLALDTIKGLKELAIEQKKSYTNNTQGD
jgi:hypothetical protein